MPYTPPSRSPAASQHSTPLHTPGVRPQLPRSNSSTAYLQRHRRSPSLPSFQPDNAKSSANGGVAAASNPNVRQSPPPLSNGKMPVGAILSPPDSSQNSSDDEVSSRAGRGLDELRELHDAVRRSLNVGNKTGSPPVERQNEPTIGDERPHLQLQLPNGDGSGPPTPTPYASATPPRLSASARKISHSRSATEDSIFDAQQAASASISLAASDDSDSDFAGGMKPPLLRKKSGELVKPAIRPQSRRKHSSMPGTPTYSKAVHFNDNIEQVRHFLQVDRPIAVSAGASPVEGLEEETEFPFGFPALDWELNLKNFPRDSLERMSQPVRLERLRLSPDRKSLIGTVAVANISFHKQVIARFTLDYWKTTSEVTAEYNNDTTVKNRQDGYDTFNFSIKLSDQANLEARTMLLCVRYTVNGQDHWDNNDSMNHQVDFVKKQKPVVSQGSSVEAGLVNHSIPKSRHNSPASNIRPRSIPSFDDDFSHGFDSGSIKFRNGSTTKSIVGDMPAQRRRTGPGPGGPQFSTRYDFGASLSAALSQAQAQLGDRSGLVERRDAPSSAPTTSEPVPPSSSLTPRTGVKAPIGSEADTPRPDALLANRQSLDSRAYQEFVSKFCFFGSSKPHDSGLSHDTDGAADERPSPTATTAAVDAGRCGPTSGLFLSASSLHNPKELDATTPLASGEHDMKFGYPFSPESHSAIATPQSQTPTAIPG